jgi:hypothetical protein
MPRSIAAEGVAVQQILRRTESNACFATAFSG